MGKTTGFMEIARHDLPALPVGERVRDYHEFYLHLPDAEMAKQGARCMD